MTFVKASFYTRAEASKSILRGRVWSMFFFFFCQSRMYSVLYTIISLPLVPHSVRMHLMTEGALQTGALSALLHWEVKGQEAVMQCKCTGMGFRVH